jgi:hypothetical protein
VYSFCGLLLVLACVWLAFSSWLSSKLDLHLLDLLLVATCPSPPDMSCWFFSSWLGLELQLTSMVLLDVFE